MIPVLTPGRPWIVKRKVLTIVSCDQERHRVLECVDRGGTCTDLAPLYPTRTNDRQGHCDLCGAKCPPRRAIRCWCKKHKHLVFRCAPPVD